MVIINKIFDVSDVVVALGAWLVGAFAMNGKTRTFDAMKWY